MKNSTTSWCRLLEIIYLLGLIFFSHCSLVEADIKEINMFSTPERDDEKSTLKTYIVFAKKPERSTGDAIRSEDLNSWYQSVFLAKISTISSDKKSRMVHTYRNVVTGFAARLTEEEVNAMEKTEGFVSAQQERILPLQTTHTPNFLGLKKGSGFWNESNLGEGVIIGVLDTGVPPDHPSFNDEGLPPPPKKWKGKCEFYKEGCNNKLIGARNLLGGDGVWNPYDKDGHGTHTSTTAAGNFVKDASAFENANGTAVGIAPLAHLAIYKVCSDYGCSESAILAAMDAAIEDGVDILSLSLGGGSFPFYDDPIAIGAFAAMRNGIFVSCSAGNEGPSSSILSNEAPWILTVGASTIDRTIKATARLGNGDEYDGESLFQPKDFNSTLLPLVYAGANGNQTSAYCAKESLRNIDAKGKIVLCESGGVDVYIIDKGIEVRNVGGVAMILMNEKRDGFSILAYPHVLPATSVSYDAGSKIKDYINSTLKPEASILFKGTVIENDSYAPAVTSFSSRGPSKASPGILKPDVIGPGVNILAGWPFPADYNSKSKFNIISGTSMSCPHLSGIAALLKSSHPDWSPSAIKSAIMTTADVVDRAGNPIVDETLSPASIFATGAGHVNPSKANDPGLVYEIEPEDYVPYLCGLNYTDSQIRVITQTTASCSVVQPIAEAQLNYPTFSVDLGDEKLNFTRTVTNVGVANSSYSVEISAPPGIGVNVTPKKLIFTELNQKATYTVEFIPQGEREPYGGHYSQGYLSWVSEKHSVRSPISVRLSTKSDSKYASKVSVYLHVFHLFVIVVLLLS